MYIDVYKYSSYSKRSDHSFYCKKKFECARSSYLKTKIQI